MFKKIRKNQKKLEQKRFKEEFKDMTEDEAILIQKMNLSIQLRKGRPLSFDEARLVMKDYRAHKADAFDQGVTPDILAARKNLARREWKKRAVAKRQGITPEIFDARREMAISLQS